MRLQQFHPQELHTAAFLQPKVSNELENKADRHTHTHDAAAVQRVSQSATHSESLNNETNQPKNRCLLTGYYRYRITVQFLLNYSAFEK